MLNILCRKKYKVELYLVGFKEARLQGTEVSKYLPPVQVLLQMQKRNEDGSYPYGEWYDLRVALEQRLSEYIRKRRDGIS